MRIRKAIAEEFDEIFLMGYDAWGGNLPMQMYIESCLASYKYKLGQFYVLESLDGHLVSSCIVYPLKSFGGVVSESAVGFGSIVTAPGERHKGYASLMLTALMKKLEDEGVDAFFLHSDIQPKIYESIGFVPAPENLRAKSDGAVPMLRLKGGRKILSELWREIVMPDYF